MGSSARTNRAAHPRGRRLGWLGCGLAFLLAPGTAGVGYAAPAEAAPGELLRTGERVYREGLLASGEPVAATVQGDVPVDGSQFTCVSCHRRSGMGAIEGDRVVSAVSGPELLAPRSGGYAPRPGYSDETLARALRDGVDPAGRTLDPMMPRYRLPQPEMEALIAYLKALGVVASPGVTDEEIHLATVVTEGVDPEREKAMLDVIETFTEDKNRQTRAEQRRAEVGPFYQEYRTRAYRRWVFHTWRLTGSAETWGQQLESYESAQPVFALVSGLAAGAWRPIHEFCERRALPCVLPNTELPALEKDSYYTLYFSRGVAIEAEALARHVSDDAPEGGVLQVFRDEALGSTAARTLREALEERGVRPLADWRVDREVGLSAGAVAERLERARATVLVLWLGAEDLSHLSPAGLPGAERVYTSSILLDGDLSAVPESLRRSGYAVQPFSLPRERQGRSPRVRAWLRARGIESAHERIQSQTYFACRLVGRGLSHVKRYFSRDYFVDSIDHAESMAPYSVHHPRLSFGPGQRYLSKGCYVIALAGDPMSLGERAVWVVP